MKVAVDFDGTLSDLHTLAISLINLRHGTTYTVQDISSWGWFKEAGVYETFQLILDMLDTSYIDRAIPPTSIWACPTVKWLTKRGHDVEILSSNEPLRAPKLAAWLFSHGLDTPVRCLGRISAAEKLRLGHTYFIDDSPEIVQAIASEPGKHLLLVDRPWNWNCHLTDNITRVVDWYEMKQHLEALGL